MTHAEVYRELERDRENLTTWWHHQLEAQRRRAIKAKAFPLKLWFEYTSTRKIQYLIFTRIFDKRMRTILTGMVALRREQDGTTAYTTWLSHQRLITPIVILPHAWKRYAERAKVEKKGIDLLKHYFANNPFGKDSDNQNVVGRSVRYNGEEHLSYCVNDGIMLGQQRGDVFVVKTFITYDMTCGRQQQEFEDKRKQIKTDREMYEEARRFYW